MTARSAGFAIRDDRREPAVGEVGRLVLRLFAGLALAFGHGLGKLPPSPRFVQGVEKMGLPLPEAFSWAAGLSEFAGGLLLAVGLLTRPASFFILLTMLVAAVLRHAADPFVAKEKALLFAAVALFFLLAGAGRFSLDAMIRRSRGRR
ncbi:MAG: DoxX family protein [Thermoanaerobaculia bacterium]